MRNSSISFSFIFLIVLVASARTVWGKIVHVDSPHHTSRPIAGSINRVRAFNEGITPPHSPIMTDDFGRFITPGENGECSFMPEIVMLQDVSGSYEDDLLNLQAQMPALFQFFKDEFNGNVRFGVTTFIDSPLLGDVNDYCARVELPLIAVDTPESIEKAAKVFGDLTAGGGGSGDWLEGANTGMMRVAASNLAGWSSDTHDPITGKPIVRILVIGTDAAMHEAGWHVAEAGLDVPPSSLLSLRDELNTNINSGCNSMDYPDGREIGVVFKERGITPVILAGQPWFWKKPGTKGFYKQYTNILEKYGQKKGPWSDFDTGLAAYYADFLKEQVRVDGIVTNIDNTSSNFVDVLKYAMREVTELTCRIPSTSTTEVPSNETATDPPVYPPHSSTTQLPASTSSTSTSIPETSTSFLSSTSSSSAQGEASSSSTSTSSSLPSTSSSLGGQGSTTSTTTTTTTTTKGSSGGSSAIIIGSAAGGAAVGVVAAAAVILKKFGISGFGSSSPSPTALSHDVDNVEIEQEREQVEGVTGDLFA